MLPAPAVQDRLASHDKASTSQVVERLKQRWPCREQLIDQLAQRLSCTGSSQAPVFVFGPPATGKTAVVRWGPACLPCTGCRAALLQGRFELVCVQPAEKDSLPLCCCCRDVFRELGVRHAYVNCQEVARAKPLLSAILHQLKVRRLTLLPAGLCHQHNRLPAIAGQPSHNPPCTALTQGAKRRRDEGYDCGVKCESLAEFVHALPGGWGERPGHTHALEGDSGAEKAVGHVLSL